MVISDILKRDNISVLEWHGSSSDLNPIENQRAIIEDKVVLKQPSSALDNGAGMLFLSRTHLIL